MNKSPRGDTKNLQKLLNKMLTSKKQHVMI